MRYAASAYVIAAALVVGAAGCTRAGVPTELPRDLVRMSSGSDLPGWNPLVFDNATVSNFGTLIHGYLMRADGEGRLIPDLATQIPTRANGGISPDGRTVIYHLRRGVRWHDGAPFDAKDVVFSFAAAMNPNNAVPDRTGFDHVAACARSIPTPCRSV